MLWEEGSLTWDISHFPQVVVLWRRPPLYSYPYIIPSALESRIGPWSCCLQPHLLSIFTVAHTYWQSQVNALPHFWEKLKVAPGQEQFFFFFEVSCFTSNFLHILHSITFSVQILYRFLPPSNSISFLGACLGFSSGFYFTFQFEAEGLGSPSWVYWLYQHLAQSLVLRYSVGIHSEVLWWKKDYELWD